MKIRAFITHKKAEHFQDCQDRFCVNADTKSAAVSDGMSQSIFQNIWAEIIVQAYTQDEVNKWNPSKETDQKTVKTKLSEKWEEQVRNRVLEMQREGRNTIRTENSLAVGMSAGATLAGVRFDGNRWVGEVMGDSCIVEINGSNIKQICTSQDVDAFDNHPDYFDSNPKRQGKGTPKQFEGELVSNMALLIVSDPFSDFLFEKKKTEKESQFIKELRSVESHDAFENLVARWRTDYGMHNDDSTLLIIEPDNSTEWTILSEDNINQLIDKETETTATQALPNPFHPQTVSLPTETVKEENHNLQINLSDAQKRCAEAEEDYKRLEEENKKLREECQALRKEKEQWQSRLVDESYICKFCFPTHEKFHLWVSHSKYKKIVKGLIDLLCDKFDFYKK